MIEKIIQWLRRVREKLISKHTVGQAIGTELALSTKMESAIAIWSCVYAGHAPWLNTCVRSLGLAAAICSKVARVATIERRIKIQGGERADYLQSQFKIVDTKLREQLERGLAKGGMMFKPYVSGGEILIDCVQADCFAPTAVNGRGDITGAVFLDTVRRDGLVYTRLEAHDLEGNSYSITNTAFRSKNELALGTRVPLSILPEWKDIQEMVVIQNINKSLFGYFKAPHANLTDETSPLGESIFSRALAQLKEADEHWERYSWEFESAERSIYANTDAIKLDDPKKERLLRLGEFDPDKGFYEEFSPDIRETPFYARLQAVFKRIEFNCGLAYGMISDPQSKELTATEVISSKQDLYDTVEDIHRSIEAAIDGLIYGMDVLATLYNLSPRGSYSVVYDWGDSVLTDRDTERAIRMQEVAAGLSSAVEYRMWRYCEDERTARKNLAPLDSLTEE